MKKVSLQASFSFGLHAVLQHFSFFALTMLLGVVSIALFLGFLNIIELQALHGELLGKFGGLVHGLHAAMHNALGVFQYAQYHVHHYLEMHLPVALAKYFTTSQAVSLDITAVEMNRFMAVYLLPGLVLKLIIDLISIAWTRVGLLTYDKKSIVYEDALLEWHLLPQYVLVNLLHYAAIVMTMMVCGLIASVVAPVLGVYAILVDLMLVFVVVYVYQRLCLARLYVVDKNMSAMDALVKSWDATENHVLELIEFHAASLILHALAYSTIILVFVVYPFQHQAEAAMYRQLTNK